MGESKTMTYERRMAELDDDQRKAARMPVNAVIAAGAGSGKTRVLATRFLHLVVERGIPVNEILALTFTNKAASEMYGRIYATLRDTDHVRSQEAALGFSAANVKTIDSFCNSVARNACRKYGVSPDFAIDDAGALELAESLALPFFLENRKAPAIGHFLRRYTQQELASSLFANTVVRHSPVSAPLDFDAFLELQKRTVATLFAKDAREIRAAFASIESIEGGTGKQWDACREVFASEIPDEPNIADRASIVAFIEFCDRVTSLTFSSNSKNPAMCDIRDIHADLKKRLIPEFLALASHALNEDIIRDAFRLLADFQRLYHEKKRAAGILTYADVARMAVDALSSDADLREAYKESFGSVMIDEFQDDNDLQRKLLFLISEREGQTDRTDPSAADLRPDKLFFVGDEKQSIYRFRGADVSVFRSLAADLATSDAPTLGTNFRTERALIDVFNAVLPYVFLNPKIYPEGAFPLYEATFSPIKAGRDTEGLIPSLDVIIVPTKRNDEDRSKTEKPQETEAAAVAERIRSLRDSGYRVRSGNGGTRPCEWNDFAILFRSRSKQRLFERALREQGIPFQAENMKGLFDDAPVNDIYALLRLAVFPADNTAYANLLRSPFVGISDRAFVPAVASRTTALAKGCTPPPPFDPSVEAELSPSDRERFAAGRELYERVRSMADRVSAAELVTHVWYAEGYRYAALLDPALHRYLELYDYLFELARRADADGLTLAAFLDRLGGFMEDPKKLDDLDIPVERVGGVKLTTIHKSKGLEYPIVFVVDSGSQQRAKTRREPVYVSKDYGVSVNTGGSEDARSAEDNWFYVRDLEGEILREQAELRRLLYVAMTRAETRLFVTGTLETKKDPREFPSEGPALREELAEWAESRADGAAKRSREIASFFDLLMPACADLDIPGLNLRAIPAAPREANFPKNAESTSIPASLVAPFYESAKTREYKPSPRSRCAATGLRAAFPDIYPESAEENDARQSTARSDKRDELDAILERASIPANDFGTLAHRAIEARITGNPIFVPEELVSFIQTMTDRFFASELGKMALRADWIRTEYGFLTKWQAGDREISVNGQMDLVFSIEGKVHVVDYKTDRIENPEDHALQLSVYRKAAEDLFESPVGTWLFYLRSGNSVKMG
ncbi:MAG TPA: UvrD-helicase domain-containing protein [Treponemataceae bacterium]|nr:UvrD-helicase domain-containing protein [Treponemataceae bacterium]